MPHARKHALTLQKSAPIVQRSKVEVQGERGSQSSLLRDAIHIRSLSPGKESTPERDESKQDVEACQPVGSEMADVQLTSPPQQYSPSATTGKKRPLLPPKPAILPHTTGLPDKPPHSANKKPLNRLPPQHHVTPPEKSVTSQHVDKKFVIDMTSGDPVVSLPPALQAPPSSPPTTFRPSMLRPSKTSTSVLARQEQMIDALIKGRESNSRSGQPENNPHESGHSRTSGVKDKTANKKVPLLPPTASHQRRVALKHSSTNNVPQPTSA